MTKLTKSEQQKIEKQMTKNDRGNTWVGTRPAVFKNKKAYSRKQKHRVNYCQQDASLFFI